MKPIINRFAPPLLIYSGIFFLSSLPVSKLPHIAPDVVPHFLEYFLFGFFYMRMVLFKAPVTVKTLLWSFPFLPLLAFLDELHQFFVPTRHFEVKDILVDTVGCIVGVVLLVLLKYFRLKGKAGQLPIAPISN